MSEPTYDKGKAELHNNKAIYQLRKVDSLQELNLFLYAVYYVLVLISILYIYYSYDTNVYAKGILSVFLLSFPFTIRMIEKNIFDYYQYLLALSSGTPYRKD